MKKIIRRITFCLLVVVAICIGVGIYWFTHEPDVPSMADTYFTDADGLTYLAVVDSEGHTYAVVTDEDGNRYAAEFDGNKIGSTVGQINDDIALDDVPTNFTGEQIDITNDNRFTGNVATTMPSLPNSTTNSSQSGKDDTTTTKKGDSDNPYRLEAYRIEKYQKIFTSGTYLMEISTNDPEIGDMPVTMAIKNGNMYIKMAMNLESSTVNCGMLYLKSKDTMYLIFDDWKKYCKMPEEALGEDMDMGAMLDEMGSISDIGNKITVSQVEIDGQKLILESYNSTADGSTVNYYFDGETLVRKDNISQSGIVDSTYFNRITTNVPDSYFEIPSGYGYLNLNWLGLLM